MRHVLLEVKDDDSEALRKCVRREGLKSIGLIQMCRPRIEGT
ncbi:hypothetical protein HMPREF3185_00844 [Porphyromonas somerae]|uniref:Uncharacterized protein n=1 Tax=Porphyromonas somerae TaxID=322095 RepID=A0A134B9W2_9PORP|nr:hypothetical protein HMPREF3184_00844 [Porphyromonadaceae bacterium KA00676]KXB76733.1 hypothetical protein HMPREF3185_00844 [Porphyromonas somerae]